jgi:tripartite-type tricarboxylate transporter receptor subunit TctC
MVKVLAKPAVINLLAQTAYTATSSTPDELRAFLKEDSAKWNAVIKQAGIKVE